MRAARLEASHGEHWWTRTLIIAAAMLSLSSACRDSTGPTKPGLSEPTPPPVNPPPTQPAPVPPPPRSGRIYEGDDSIYALFDFSHGGRLTSRYVLSEDATFGLQFFSPRVGFFEYAGKYARADSLITFEFDSGSGGQVWEATGVLRGDSLIVEYNVAMQWSDFMNGTYVRSSGTP